ncbi:uncharacterized protein LOC108913401 [Anoplophora glabripennis]|uniref:uncharacterized protein LOC108913401 n=1 Tax=Anoplophora glabripennis TaxID=217634 RepID=UPI000C78DDE7|nr:uncharacterized protein LOC108913401 [Anoplophora glabripennis]
MLRDSSATSGFLTPKILKDALEATSSKSTMTGESPVGPVQIPSKVYARRRRLFEASEEICQPHVSIECKETLQEINHHPPNQPSKDSVEFAGSSQYAIESSRYGKLSSASNNVTVQRR